MNSTGGARRRRRNRISTTEAIAVAVVAAAAAGGAVLVGAHPTAWRPADLVLTAGAAFFVVWAAASAPWWAVLGAAAATVICASWGWPLAAALVALALAGVVGWRGASWPVVRAVAAGLVVQVALRWDLRWFAEASSVTTVAILAPVAWMGVRRRSRRTRWLVRRGAVALGMLAGLGCLAALVAVGRAAWVVRDGADELRQAVQRLKAGEFDEAQTLIAKGRSGIGRADGLLHASWAKIGLAVPGVGQHLDVLAKTVRSADRLAAVAATAAGQIDIEALSVRNGVIDLNAVELLEEPLGTTNLALRDLDATLAGRGRQWLLPPLHSALNTLGDEVGALTRQTAIGSHAVSVVPRLLGLDGPRTYFVAFTTPAEARGLGGFMGTWAEVTADRGRITVTRTGSTRDLAAANRQPRLDMPAEFIARYGGYGAGRDGGPVTVDYWSNVTMSPDFPTIAQVVGQLYPASGGRAIDGVIALDVATIASFLELTGPVRVEGLDIAIGPENATEYLLRGQYAQIADDDARDRVLSAITDAMIRDVFGSALAGPQVLADVLGPAIAERRLVVWSLHEADQQDLRGVAIDGGLPLAEDLVDGLEVVANNAGGNKLDAYLRRSVVYAATVDQEAGTVKSRLDIRLTNTVVDPLALPGDAVGNPFGLAPGTNRMLLSVYSPLRLAAAALDGQAVGTAQHTERGWRVYTLLVDLQPGQERLVSMELAGEFDPEAGYRLVAVPQPLSLPDRLRVDVRAPSGRLLERRLLTWRTVVTVGLT